MTVTVIIKAEVANFDNWKEMFSNLEEQRQKEGIKFNAYRNHEEPNNSYVIGTVPSKDIFFEFFHSPERQAIQDSVIMTSPQVTFLEKC